MPFRFSSLTLLALLTTAAFLSKWDVAWADDILPGHSSDGKAFDEGPRQAASLMNGTGKVSLAATTTSPLAQRFIDQGVGQLHGFWYYEAERSFRQAAALDGDCAMAYWGMAMANFNNAKRAKPFIEKAVQRKEKVSAREREWIEAVASYFGDSGSDVSRRRDLLKRFEDIYNGHPEELEAKAFVLWLLWDNSQHEVPIGSRLAMHSLIDQVLEAEPNHPAHHYRIHIGDLKGPNKVKTFLSAAMCGPAAPAIPHMWHMPGHTYSDARRYYDGAWQQEAALRVEHAHLIRAGLMPDETSLFVHNRGWLIENLDYTGQVQRAVELCRHLTELPRHPRFGKGVAADGRKRLLQVLSHWNKWDELVAYENDPKVFEATEDEQERLVRARFFGRACFMAGRVDQGRGHLARLGEWKSEAERGVEAAVDKAAAEARERKESEELVTKAREKAKKQATEKVQNFEDLCTELRGFERFAAGDAKGALEDLAKLKNLEKEVLAMIAVEAGDAAKGDQWSSDHQNKLVKLAVRVDVLYRSGKVKEARALFDELRPLASKADLDLPPFQRLKPAIQAWGLPADWRTEASVPTDLGFRPELDSLGPFLWHPSPAPGWTLKDLDGRQVSLSDYQGKPVILLFYLGFGCVHCVEQLNAFAPMSEKFKYAGVSIVAISSDPAEAMRASAATRSTPLPFPLLSDESLATFKAGGIYDDFEQKPLHGAFLVDGEGLIRWRDVGADPFTNADFLLNETRRLLGQNTP